MCTVTWMFAENGYELFFNRDELHTRQVAIPPKVHRAGQVSFIAPIDADAGGTWMGVNQFGVSLCLLNGYSKRAREHRAYRSRGLLVLDLLDCADASEVDTRLRLMGRAVYRAFTLVAFEPNKSVVAWHWDGEGLHLDESLMCPLISSSIRLPEVEEYRRQLFDELETYTAKTLTEFHRSHVPEAGPLSVCLHRADAKTVSLNRVVVTSTQVGYHYMPGSPCKNGFLPPVSIARVK